MPREVMTQTPSSSCSFFGAGKVILLGEHAVVYGQPALAFALKQGVWAVADVATSSQLHLPRALRGTRRADMKRAFGAAAQEVGLPRVSLRLDSDLPLSMGLGSSAAVSVAVSKALLHAARRPLSTRAILDLARRMEEVFHATPSGVDHSTSVYQSAIRFKKGPVRPSVKKLHPLKPMEFVVAWAGRRGSTAQGVEALRQRHKKRPLRYQHLFAEIGWVVDEGVRAFQQGDVESLGDLMNINHALLTAMHLSKGALEDLVYTFRRLGAVGAKMTGAGGVGGAVVGLFSNAAWAQRKLSSMGIPCLVSRVEDSPTPDVVRVR